MSSTMTRSPVRGGERQSRQGSAMIGVAMLIHRFHPHLGGAETQLKALVPHLKARGVDVLVIARPEPGAPQRDVVDGARVFRTPISEARGAASIGYTVQALRWLRKHRPSIDVVHAHGLLSPTTTAAVARLLLGTPAIVTTHGFQADLSLLRDGFLGSQRLRLFAHIIDRFVVISDEIGVGLRSVGIAKRKLISIRNGIDTARFAPPSDVERFQSRKQLAVADRRVVVYVGRLEPVKGADYLLEAWPSVLARVPDAQLLIAGDGSSRAALEARKLPRVRFLGAQPDPISLYRAADCYVLPSRSEGLPVALLEALSVGVLVVSTAVGGVTEILRGFESRALVGLADSAALADRLVDRLAGPTDPLETTALRNRIRQEYSIERTADHLAALYGELAALGPRR